MRARARKELKPKVIALRRLRSVGLGDHVTVQFEDEQTIRYQIQEMLRIEKIFEPEGIQQEIDAYAPLGITQLAVDSIFMMPHLGVLSTVNEQAAKTSGAKVEPAIPQAKTQEEYFKNQQKLGTPGAAGYPGAKGKTNR